jgi:hypothetical protein
VKYQLGLSQDFKQATIVDGVIKGVAVVTEGPVLGHNVSADATTLQTVLQCANEFSGGVRVKMDHGTGSAEIVGILRSFRIDGTVLRADLTLFQNSDYYGLITEMAQVAPEAFGLSISFSGSKQSIDDQNFIRCQEIYSVDIVDAPAANPSGLFSKKNDMEEVTKKDLSDVREEITNGLKLSTDRLTPLEKSVTDLDLEVAKLEHIPELVAKQEENVRLAKTELEKKHSELETAFKELATELKALREECAEADIIAGRRVGAMGFRGGKVTANDKKGGGSGEPDVLVELNKVMDPLKKYQFLTKNREKIHEAMREFKR